MFTLLGLIAIIFVMAVVVLAISGIAIIIRFLFPIIAVVILIAILVKIFKN